MLTGLISSLIPLLAKVRILIVSAIERKSLHFYRRYLWSRKNDRERIELWRPFPSPPLEYDEALFYSGHGTSGHI